MKENFEKSRRQSRKTQTCICIILLLLLTTQFMSPVYTNAATDAGPLLQADYLTIDVGFRAAGYMHDTDHAPTDTATEENEEAVFSAYVNKACETLTSYTLTPTFTGDVGTSKITVYKIDALTGQEVLVTSGYTLSGNTISFASISDCYRVEYAVATAKSFTDASMQNASGSVQISASFDASFVDEDTQSHDITDKRIFQPLTLQGDNSDLRNNSIIVDLDIQDPNGNGNPIILKYLWSLVDLETKDGGVFDLSMLAGNYYILQVDTSAIQLFNSTSGDLLLSPEIGGAVVGTYYMDKTSGKVIFTFNNFVEDHDHVGGYFEISSRYTTQHKPEEGVLVDLNTGTTTVFPDDTQVNLNISKRNSGFSGNDMDKIGWTVTVNSDFKRVKNLIITDKNISTSALWTYDYTTLVVTETSVLGGNAVTLTEGTHYTVTKNENKSFTIQILGNAEGYTSSQYEINFTGLVTNISYYGTYQNDAEAKAENADLVTTDTTALRSEASLSKTYRGFDSSTSTVDWRIVYNGNKASVPIANAVLNDRPTVDWLNEKGIGLDSVPLTINANSFVVTIGTTTLTQNVDYTVAIEPDGSFALTFLNTNAVTGGTGYLQDTVTVEYKAKLVLSNPPAGAVGWRFKNDVTRKDGEGSTEIHTGSVLKKAFGTLNYSAHTATWTTTVNSAGLPMPDKTKIYDVLPNGFTMDISLTDSSTFSIKNSRNGSNALVIPSGEPLTPAQQTEGYFEYSSAPFSLKDGENTVNVAFTLTFHPGSIHLGTDEYVIFYRTAFVYDPAHVGEPGYASYSNVNYAYLYYSGDTDMDFDAKASDNFIINSNYRANSSKSGQFVQSPTDMNGSYVASEINWTVRCNYWNNDINGAVFTDELQSGLTGSEGSEIADCDQVIIDPGDVRLYSYTVAAGGLAGAIGTTDLSTIFAAAGQSFDVDIDITVLANGNSKLIITFPSDFENKLIAAGVTDSTGKANMRFAVVITSTLKDGLAPHYPNAATLTRDKGEDKVKAGLSITAATAPGEKAGRLDSDRGLIDYTAVLNKDQKQIRNLEIRDALAYTAAGEQILFLLPDSLKLYTAKIVVTPTGVTTYEKGDQISNSKYTLRYDVKDTLVEAEQGFDVIFSPDYILERVPIIVEYQCGYNRVGIGAFVANSISLTGYELSQSTTTVQIHYTDTSGGTQGDRVNFSLKKVDGNGNILTGAQFTMLNFNKTYAVAIGEVDQNGVLAFNNFVTGTYYLYESRTPNGFTSQHGDFANALQIQVRNLGGGVAEVRVNGIPISDSTGQFTMKNTGEFGSVKLTKYKNDTAGKPTTNTLSGAVFRLYKYDSAITKLYFIGYDANGVAKFELDQDPPVPDSKLTTDANGVIAVSNLPFGRYYFEEISAPTGFLPVSGPIEFEITSANSVAVPLALDPVYDDVDTTSVPVKKRWDDNNNQDGKRPGEIEVQLYADGVPYGSVVKLNAGNLWQYEWEKLPKYNDSTGALIDYTVNEVSVPDGYTMTPEPGGVIVNTHIPEQTAVDVTKIWQDNNNQDGLRPPSIQVQLRGDGANIGSPVTLSETNHWKHTWPNLDKYANGALIQYTVVEVSNTLGEYAVEIRQDSANQYSWTITNTRTPDETSRTVVKNWDDDSNRDGKRPPYIQAQLLEDGVPSARPDGLVTLNAANGWTYTWNNLPKNKAGGTEIVYTVTETNIPDVYTVSYSDSGFTINNDYKPETTERSVVKDWQDNGNQDGLRPLSIQVQLYADGTPSTRPDGLVTLNVGNGWAHTWSGLNKYANGVEIVYEVREVSVPTGYTVSYSENTYTYTFTVTNTHAPEKTRRIVSKDWQDNNNQDGLRPPSIQVQLLADGVVMDTDTLSAANNWRRTWENLDKYAGGVEIVYTIKEVIVPVGYSESGSVSGDYLTAINTHIPETTSRTVTKFWEDNNDKYGIQPTEIQVQLYADGKAYGSEIALNQGNAWMYTWTNLPKYAAGKEIVYTVKEVSVPDGYQADYSPDTFTITNTALEDTDVSVTKRWEDNNDQDAIRPPDIKVQLLADGSLLDTVTLSATNTWSYTWPGLPRYTSNNTPIQYTVAEVSTNLGEYAVNVRQDSANQYSWTITNTRTPDETSRTVVKNWDDGNNVDKKRPTKISVQLYADGKAYGSQVELNDSNGWTYRWNHLPVKEAGKEIVYTVQETTVPDGYKESYDGFTITNTYIPEVTTRTVTKLWTGDGQGSNRPASIKVQLLADGVAYGDPVSLTSKNSWVYEWKNLPKYADDKEIIYSVKEIQVPNGYKVTYSKDGFTITNSYTTESKYTSSSPHDYGSNDGKDGSSIPKTREERDITLLLLYWMSAILSGGGLLLMLLLRRKENRPTR